MFVPFVIPLAGQLLITVANVAVDVPKFDVTASCRAAAQASNTQDRFQTCLQSEQHAREEVVQQWSKFAPADRSLCAQTAAAGGEPTYTELITCLEMARDSRAPPTQGQSSVPAPNAGPTTSGVATPGMLHRQPRRSDVPDAE